MLDRVRVAEKIARLSFAGDTRSQELSRAAASRLKALCQNVLPGVALTEKITVLRAQNSEILDFNQDYSVLGVDGSQIYPDRSFAGGQLAILNVGGIFLDYGEVTSSADFFSRPECLTRDVCFEEIGPFSFCPELIDLLRSVRELEVGLERWLELAAAGKAPAFLLFDGSMIHHGLHLKNIHLQRYFMERFARVFGLFREHGIVAAWYTSLPQSRTLAALVGGEVFCDADLFEDVLSSWAMSPVFCLAQHGFAGVQVDFEDSCAFVYFSTGDEIVRLEVARWVARDLARYEKLCSMIKDQVQKGLGYPVALTESHRQAVVAEADRQCILQLLEHMPQHSAQTTKALRKLIIPV